MYKNILLLIDCSHVDQTIVYHIKDLARIHGSRVHLFNVIHAHTMDQERIMTEQQTEYFKKFTKEFQEANIEVESSTALGEPNELVLQKASEPIWDLVAMATHGHKGISDFILGSVSDKLKHKLNKPLLLIHG